MYTGNKGRAESVNCTITMVGGEGGSRSIIRGYRSRSIFGGYRTPQLGEVQLPDGMQHTCCTVESEICKFIYVFTDYEL